MTAFDEFDAPKDVDKSSDSTTSNIASEAYSRNQPARLEQSKSSDGTDTATDLLGPLTLYDASAAKKDLVVPTDPALFRLDVNNLPPLTISFDATPTFDASPTAKLDSAPINANSSDASSAPRGATNDRAPRPGSGPTVGDAPPQVGDSGARAGGEAAGRPGSEMKTASAFYLGEGIKRDVPMDTYKTGAGENLHDIAKKHLGPGASEADVQKHMKEIAHVNFRNTKDPLPEGTTLILPGHTKDGGFISTISERTGTRTVWRDGRVKEEYADGTGFERTPVPHKGKLAKELDNSFPEYVEKHHGPKPQDNYEIHKVIGEYYIKEPGKEEFKPLPGTDVRYDKAKLNDIAERNIKDPQAVTEFKEDMATFERRAREAKPPLSQEEIAKTYHEIGRLLEAGGDKPLSREDRIKLAQQVLHHAAHPESVQQGNHSTCNVATVESRMYTREPSAAARMVTDVATTGEFKRNDGKIVKVDPDSLKPHDTSKKPPNFEDRDYASQVFQVTAVNVHYAENGFKGFDKDGKPIELPPGKVKYMQVEPTGPDDSGERLMDVSDPANPKPVYEKETKTGTDEHGQPTTKTIYKEVKSPGIPSGELTDIYDSISRKVPSDRGVVIENNSENHADPEKMKAEAKKIHDACHIYGNDDEKIFGALKDKTPAQLEEMNRQFQLEYGKSIHDYLKHEMRNHPEQWKKAQEMLTPKEAVDRTDIVYVKSPEELESKIKELKEQGKLPTTIMVDSNNDPFFMDSGGGKAGGSGGWHVVNITDYHPAENGKPARVDIQNQWGENSHHFDRNGKAISINDLYESTFAAGRAEQVKRLQKEVADNKASGHVDSVKELQLLRMQLANGMINEQKYAEGVAKVMRDADERWQKPDNRESPEEAKRVREYYRAMLYGLGKRGLQQTATGGVKEVDWNPDYEPTQDMNQNR